MTSQNRIDNLVKSGNKAAHPRVLLLALCLLAELRLRQLCSNSRPHLEAARLTVAGCWHHNTRVISAWVIGRQSCVSIKQARLLQLGCSNTNCRRASANRNTSGLRAHITGVGRLRVSVSFKDWDPLRPTSPLLSCAKLLLPKCSLERRLHGIEMHALRKREEHDIIAPTSPPQRKKTDLQCSPCFLSGVE